MDIGFILGRITGVIFLIFSLYLCVVIFIKGIKFDVTGTKSANKNASEKKEDNVKIEITIEYVDKKKVDY